MWAYSRIEEGTGLVRVRGRTKRSDLEGASISAVRYNIELSTYRVNIADKHVVLLRGAINGRISRRLCKLNRGSDQAAKREKGGAGPTDAFIIQSKPSGKSVNLILLALKNRREPVRVQCFSPPRKITTSRTTVFDLGIAPLWATMAIPEKQESPIRGSVEGMSNWRR